MTHTRIYAGGAFCFGQDIAVNDIKAAGYSALIIWSLHVTTKGSLQLNDTVIVENGNYTDTSMNLPSRLAQLHQAGIEIIFSVGSGGASDFANIGTLSNGTVPTKGNIIYDNFAALKSAMVAAGGDIDAVDFDNEEIENWDPANVKRNTQIMVNFGCMLGDIGYKSVNFCPYQTGDAWTNTYTDLLKKKGKGFVSAINLQCYSGGRNSNPQDWGKMIADAGGDTLLIPGLGTNQAQPGPWWDGKTKSPGGSVVKTPDVAMYGQADWSNELWRGNFSSADEAMQAVKGGETFFFYCNSYMDLGPGKVFNQGDAVFFGGRPWWGSAPQCDAYSLSGGCSNIYNNNGACPSDLESQYAKWSKETYPINGGFIWLYDSIISCLLSDCCNESDKSTSADVATAYRKAITNGVS